MSSAFSMCLWLMVVLIAVGAADFSTEEQSCLAVSTKRAVSMGDQWHAQLQMIQRAVNAVTTSITEQRKQEEIAKKRGDENLVKRFATAAARGNRIADSINALQDEVQRCIGGRCDAARVTQRVLGVSSRVMKAAPVLVPWGPLAAQVLSALVGFFVRSPNPSAPPPPLTTADIRQVVRGELRLQELVRFRTDIENMVTVMVPILDQLQDLVIQVEYHKIPDPALLRSFETARTAIAREVRNNLRYLGEGTVRRLRDFRRDMIGRKLPFTPMCHVSCPNLNHNAWQPGCQEDIARVSEDYWPALEETMHIFEDAVGMHQLAGGLMNTIQHQQNWPADAQVDLLTRALGGVTVDDPSFGQGFIEENGNISYWCNEGIGRDQKPLAISSHCDFEKVDRGFQEGLLPLQGCNYGSLYVTGCHGRNWQCPRGHVNLGRFHRLGRTCRRDVNQVLQRLRRSVFQDGTCPDDCGIRGDGANGCLRPWGCVRHEECRRLVRGEEMPYFTADVRSDGENTLGPNKKIQGLRQWPGPWTFVVHADCRLALYNNASVAPEWYENSFGRADCNQPELVMQEDGNLVFYRVSGRNRPVIWSSGTSGTGPYVFRLTSRGELQVRDSGDGDRVLWSNRR